MGNCAFCWLRNVEGNFTAADHVDIESSFRCEVRHSYFHDAFVHGPGTFDECVMLAWRTSACLVEDNIMWRLHTSLILNQGAAGNVIAYNFSTNAYLSGNANFMPEDFTFCHGSHTMFNLMEGNVVCSMTSDSIWGSSSHNTMYRNYVAGSSTYSSPQDVRYGGSTSTPLPAPTGLLTYPQYQGYYAEGIDVTDAARYHNVVGNMVGSPWVAQNADKFYLSVVPASRSMYNNYAYEFNFGYSETGSNDNALANTTAILEGNWDVINNTQMWYGMNPVPLTNSFYLSSKPTYFGTCPWPPIDAANPNAFSPTNLPAACRFFYGADPTTGPANLPPIVVLGVSTNSVITNQPVNFSSAGSYDPEGTSLTFQWNFGDGGNSSLASPSHIYSTNGTFSVQLQVSDGRNITTTNATITVKLAGLNLPPTVSASASTLGGTAPLVVVFSSAGSFDPEGVTLTYTWTFGDGATSTAANPSHTYLAAGTYSAQLKVSDGVNTTPSALLSITATSVATNQPPAAVASATPMSGVAPLSVAFSSSGSYDPEGAALTYSWVFGDGTTSAATNPSHAYQSVGTYAAQLTVSDGTNTTSSIVLTIAVASSVTNSSSGLVAAYGFEEGSGSSLSDASGNGNNGTISGATWTTAGKYGNALLFNGTSALVTINDSTSLHLTTAMTLEAWVNPSAVSIAWRDVVYKGKDNYFLEATTTSGGGVPCGAGTFGTANVWALGTAVLAMNTWTHIATTYDGATLRFYVNGIQVSSLAQTGSIVTSSNPLQIGGDSIFGQYFQGTIDEVRVYNTVLTAAQIQADMNTPVSQLRPAAPTGLHPVGP
jgi:PKD repeat protein